MMKSGTSKFRAGQHWRDLGRLSLVLFGTLIACDAPPRNQSNPSQLPGASDIVVAVGHRSLSVGTLALLQARAQVHPAEFVTSWAADSLLAESAREGALHSSRVSQVERSVLARGLLESIYDQARKLGQPTERELREITSERWPEFDRPAAAQTTHFVVRVREGQPVARAELLARRLAEAVHACKTSEDFRTIVDAFPKESGLEVVAESLPPVTSDGRSLRMKSDGQISGAGPSFDPKFAQAANSLVKEGEQSEIVRSSFGLHVIRLDHKFPSQRASIETQREQLTDEVYLRRARQETDHCIENARQRYPVKVETSFQEVVAQLQAAQ